jgi:hypothetical protein
MQLDVQVYVVGVEGVRAWPQNRREPAAGRGPYRAEVGSFLRARLPLDEDPALVRERDRREIDRQPLGVSADLGPGDAVLGAAVIAGTGVDRRNLGAQRRLAQRRDNEADIVGEDGGEFASDKRAVGQAHRFAFRRDR